MKYQGGLHFAWCSEYYDPAIAPAGSAAAAIAPSSSPKGIFDALKADCEREEKHSALIKNHRKTFKRLAGKWLADGQITRGDHDEIVAVMTAPSWRIWRPVLYIIPRAPIEAAGRRKKVPLSARAAYGPEFQISDLHRSEFDLIECSLR